MKKSKNTIKSTWSDPDDAPELTKAWFETADLHVAGKLARKGRPPKQTTKTLISLRLDKEVIRQFKAHGSGWQTRMNEVLKTWAKKHPA